jgi:ribosomal protein L10
MPSKFTSKEKTRFLKNAYIDSVLDDFKKYNKIVFVDFNNVTSYQLTNIRKQLRGKAVIHMGKNTLLQKAFSKLLQEKYGRTENELLEQLFKEHIGLIATNESAFEISNVIQQNRDYIYAKESEISPCDVMIPSGSLPFDPKSIGAYVSICQAANIIYRLRHGCFWIMREQLLLREGNKVTKYQAELLRMFNLKPFTRGLKIVQLYENVVFYDPCFLTLSDMVNNSHDELYRLNLLYAVATAFQDVLSVARETGVTFKEYNDYQTSWSDYYVKFIAPKYKKHSRDYYYYDSDRSNDSSPHDAFGGLF